MVGEPVYREFSSALTTLDRAENPVTPWLTTKHTETKREQDTNAYVYHIRVYTIDIRNATMSLLGWFKWSTP